MIEPVKIKNLLSSPIFWVAVVTAIIGGLEAVQANIPVSDEVKGILIVVLAILGILLRFLKGEQNTTVYVFRKPVAPPSVAVKE